MVIMAAVAVLVVVVMVVIAAMTVPADAGRPGRGRVGVEGLETAKHFFCGPKKIIWVPARVGFPAGQAAAGRPGRGRAGKLRN